MKAIKILSVVALVMVILTLGFYLGPKVSKMITPTNYGTLGNFGKEGSWGPRQSGTNSTNLGEWDWRR